MPDVQKHLTASQFEQAMAYVRLSEKNKTAAFNHLVKGISVPQIAETMDCTRQNVHRIVKRVLDGFQEHTEAEERLNS
jgi:predicted DNA-binding protein YlxM (UPF0122 family)